MMKSISSFITQLLQLLLLFGSFVMAYSLQPTLDPPLLDVPTYSLATRDSDGNTGMNILTYATPISSTPERIWSIGLFKGTVAHENFVSSESGILQLLSPEHSKVVRLLGGSSGRDVDKKKECEQLGMSWISSNYDNEEEEMPEVLPGCVQYLKIQKIGDLIDCGSHDLAICKVEAMFVPSSSDDSEQRREHLKTATLRDLGIITEQGRVAE